MSEKLIKAIEDQDIIDCIRIIRRQKVMLDRDLARMYSVPTKRLNEAVKRNLTRFPPDFMFELTEEEFQILRSQFATSKREENKDGRGGQRYKPYAFTEQGVAMLSSILNSEIAIQEIQTIFKILKELLVQEPPPAREPIGFKIPKK